VAEEEKDIFGGLFDAEKEQVQPETVGAINYLTDVPIGVVKGLSQAVQGLISLGALPIDYLANTNLISSIDNLFNKITPDTKTAVGDITSVVTQFGVPLGIAAKIANGVLKLNKASQIVKLNNFRKADDTYDFLGAGAELAKRAGYWGSLGGVTDFVVSTPGDLTTLSETVGFGDAYKGNELDGSAKAVEYFKEKLRFGAEGAVLGGGLTAALPVAGTLGVKYGLMPAAKVGAFVGNNLIVRPLNAVVFNPIGKLAATETVGKGARGIGEFLNNQSTKLREYIGLPDPKMWKFYPTNSNASFKEKLLKRIDNFKNLFTDVLPTSQADELRKFETSVQADEKSIVKIMNGIDKNFKEIAKGADIMELPKYLQTSKLKYPKPITAIDDQMYLRNNDILFNYIQAPRVKTVKDGKELFKDSEEGIKFLEQLPKKTQYEAKELKRRINDLGLKYGKLLFNNTDEAIKDFGATIIANGGAYLKQVFSVMQNKAYAFDPQKIKGAKEFFKKFTVPKIVNEQPELIDGLMKNRNINRNEAIELFADNTMSDLQKSLLQSNRDPESLFRLISKSFKITDTGKLRDVARQTTKEGKDVSVLTSEGKLIRAGGSLQDVMKKVLDAEGAEAVGRAFLEPLKDYRAAVTDTFIQTAKNVYKKEFFDKFADGALKNGYAFRSIEEARAAGVPTQNLQQITSEFSKDAAMLESKILQSELFDGGITLNGTKGGLFTTPEIANAVKGTEEYLSKLYDVPLYSAVMSVKAVGQIGKTVFSPMTQVRNVSTASFFVLASGLIGGRVSLTDSFKLMADDIFPGKYISAADVAKKMEDRIARGVVDQNIEVNEIKAILQKAKDGKFTLSALMNAPIVKKAFDLYQGGDNVWKIYADDFYQDALSTAFQYNAKGLKGDAAIRDNIIDWYRTVGKQNDVVEELISASKKIDNIDAQLATAVPPIKKQSLINQKDNLVQQFKNIKDISAYLVTNTIPTYSKVPPIIKNIRQLPIGNFVAFPAEILRTSAHLLEIGARELTSTNPYIRQMGARRLVGVSAVFGGVGAVIESAAESITGVSPEKMEAFKRSVAPDYQKNSKLIPITESDENGNFKYFNFSYTNPYDSMTRPVNAILNAFGNGTLTNQNASQIVYNALVYDNLNNAPGAFLEFLTPFISESIGAGAVADLTIRNGKTKDGRTIYYPKDNAMEVIDASLGHLLGQLEPGFVRSSRRVWKGVTQEFTDFGTTYDGATELIALMSGLRVEEAKPMDSLPFIVTSYSKDLENIQRKFSSNIYNPNLDLNGRIGYMTEYLTDNYDTQSRMYRVIQDMEIMGADIDQIEEVLNNRLKNKKRLNAIMNGEFIAPNISEARIESIIDKLYDGNPIKAAEVENQFDEALSLFDDMRSDLEDFELGEGPELFRQYINYILNPSLAEPTRIPTTPVPRTAAPRVELDSGITGAPVAVINQNQGAQNLASLPLGQRYNILPSSLEKSEFLDRIV
jgi:hypothetical protein